MKNVRIILESFVSEEESNRLINFLENEKMTTSLIEKTFGVLKARYYADIFFGNLDEFSLDEIRGISSFYTKSMNLYEEKVKKKKSVNKNVGLFSLNALEEVGMCDLNPSGKIIYESQI
ncbi:MAG: hypothetical protein KC516_01235 [Nanoarchaeota archaeon]|nr:hypothetical protein [Nanoarchaeota archaeon]